MRFVFEKQYFILPQGITFSSSEICVRRNNFKILVKKTHNFSTNNVCTKLQKKNIFVCFVHY